MQTQLNNEDALKPSPSLIKGTPDTDSTDGNQLQQQPQKQQQEEEQEQEPRQLQHQPQAPSQAHEETPSQVEIGWALPSHEYVIDERDLWESSSTTPNWMKNYFRWHKEQRKVLDEFLLSSSTSEKSLPVNVLYVTCLADYHKCGGTADRLLSLPFLVMIAAQSQRLLVMEWGRPAPLIDYFVPPAGGIDWRVEQEEEQKQQSSQSLSQILQEQGTRVGVEELIVETSLQANVTVVQVKFQSHDHGSIYYNQHIFDYEPKFDEIFAYVWRCMFTPVERLAQQLQAFMYQSTLVPGQYSAAHVRALYNVKKRSDDLVNKWTTNSINCAYQLQTDKTKQNQDQGHDDLMTGYHPGGGGYQPALFFASDSSYALKQAVKYGTYRQLRVVTTAGNNNDNDSNPLHLDKTKDWKQRQPQDFDGIFMDLYLLAMAKCVAFGMGGYGKLAALMRLHIFSNNGDDNNHNEICSLVHMTATSFNRCNVAKVVLKRRHIPVMMSMARRNKQVDKMFRNIFLEPMPNDLHAKEEQDQLYKRKLQTDNSFNTWNVDKSHLFPEAAANGLWYNMTKMPIWMKNYFSWHHEKRHLLKEDNWHEFKYLVVICFQHSFKCGGTSDRLRPIPFLVRLAAETNRILLIKWEKPKELEEFLVPPANGVDWRTPDWLFEKDQGNGMVGTSVFLVRNYAYADVRVVMSNMQADDHGSKYYNEQAALHDGENVPWDAFRQHYHDCWYSIFTPVPAIADQVEDFLDKMELIPGEFAFAHLRAAYGLDEGKKDGGIALRDPELVKKWTINSLNCVSNLRPGGPYFFSSDSQYAKEVAVAYGHERHVKVVARMEEENKNPLHLDLAPDWETRDASEYYPVFVDLFLMSMGRCMTFNVGGYGKWALLISGRNLTCNVRHWTEGVGRGFANRDGCTWTEPDSKKRIMMQNSKLTRPLFFPPID